MPVTVPIDRTDGPSRVSSCRLKLPDVEAFAALCAAHGVTPSEGLRDLVLHGLAAVNGDTGCQADGRTLPTPSP